LTAGAHRTASAVHKEAYLVGDPPPFVMKLAVTVAITMVTAEQPTQEIGLVVA
jgi:hypothetical protein